MKHYRAKDPTLLTVCPGEPETDAWGTGGAPDTFVAVYEHEEPECQDCQDVVRDGHAEKEHIAGPNCTLEGQGYNGWHIEAEEMRVRRM